MLEDTGTQKGEKSLTGNTAKELHFSEDLPDKMFLLASIVESSDDAIITKTSQGIITSWNSGAEQIYGYTSVEVLGQPISILVPPGHVDEVPEILERIKQGASIHHYETQRRRKDGQVIHVSVSVSPVKDKAGRIIGASTIARDITAEVEARKRSEEELRKAAERLFLLASIVEYSDDAIITKTSQGIITSWNGGAEKIYGFPANEVIGEPISILIPPGQTDEVPAFLERISRGESLHHYETVRKRKDGQLIHVSQSISPIKDQEGQLIGASTIARDVTAEVAARKQAEEKLAAASQYARSLIESSLDPLVTISPDGKITDVNEATIKVTGIKRDQLIGTDFSNYFTEPEKAREGYQQVFAKGFVTDYALTIRHKDGQLTDVLYNASVYKDAHENVIGVFAAARDVTAQQQASQYARSLIEASLDPLVTISADGKITDVNEATVRVTGVGRDELIGTDFSNYFTEPEKAREGYQQVFAKGFVTDYALTIRHKNGQLTDVLYNASVYKDTRDNVIGVFAAARDVTDQQQASQYARSLIESSLDPLVTISADGKITDVNEATVRVTGIGRDELIGTDFSNYFREPEKAREGYQQVFAKGFVTDYALTIRHKNGQLTDVLYNASVYKDTRDNVIGVFAAARDVTARNRVEEELAEQRRRELDRLAELEKFQKLTVGRELKMVELKKEIEDLRKSNEESQRKLNQRV
jgi:PAS domain S-box-containing protein